LKADGPSGHGGSNPSPSANTVYADIKPDIKSDVCGHSCGNLCILCGD
jgi:hypothetical protein